MKVIYLKLENVAGLIVGSGKNSIEIDFTSSKNKIIAIQGSNGTGKTVLLSSITPFAYVTALDERSSLSYITHGKNGYKEIHYQNGSDTYVIKHYYKASKDTHTVKSYFSMNGEELNENGNVTSFLSLVEIHLGLTQEMMRLIRLGTNVNSFITLAPARRKEYIGRLIDEIDTYLQIYKTVNEDIRVTRTLIQANNQNQYNCHVSDMVVEQDRLATLGDDISKKNSERDSIIAKISNIDSLMRGNDINDLRRKKQEAEASLSEFARTESSIQSMGLENVSIEQLIRKRSDISDQKIDTQSKINSYRISIDNTLKTIERLEMSVRKITSDNDMQSLLDAINGLKISIANTPIAVIQFMPLGSSSNDVTYLLTQLRSFNQVSQMIHTFGNRPVEVYLKLRREGKSVDKFLKDQARKASSRINDKELQSLFDQLFKDDMIITPNCDTQYMECPYYRFSETVMSIKDKLEEETFDGETLRYIQVISTNVDNILNELDRSRSIHIPDKIRDEFCERVILERLGMKLPFFDLTSLQEYLSILKEWEVYSKSVEQLNEYEHRLAIYRKSGVDGQLEQIQEARKSIDFYNGNISTLQGELARLDGELSQVDDQIGIVTKYADSKKYRKLFQSNLDATMKILVPLETAESERMELDFQLRQADSTIQRLRMDYKSLENKLNEYARLVKEGIELDQKFRDLNIILSAVSTKKGIPVVYMKNYLGRIQQLTNNLLQLIYDDELQLANFNVTQDTFEVPYVKNGTKIPDVKYGSQSEVSLITMALSFALANKASDAYNIILLDEIDAGLDESNRSAFLKMLYTQMVALKSEQVFIISHNLTQMVNVPMDCIRLSDAGVKSKLQNVIYE